MNIGKPHLQQAVERQIISREQADALWRFLQSQQNEVPQFRFNHVLYYIGGLLAIGAMTLFMTLGWEAFGGSAIVLLCLLYGVAGVSLTEFFRKRSLPIPAGICAAFVVALVPLAVYGVQDMMGLWSGDRVYRDYHRWIDWRWLLMELVTLAAGALMFWRYRYPFFADAGCGNTVVHVYGRVQLADIRFGRIRRLAVEKTGIRMVRHLDDYIGAVGGFPQPKRTRLSFLAVSFRRADLLGRPEHDGFRQRMEQVSVLPD